MSCAGSWEYLCGTFSEDGRLTGPGLKEVALVAAV